MTTPRSKHNSPKWKVFIPIIVMITIVTLGLYIIKLQLGNSSRPQSNVSIRVDSILPDFSLTDMKGNNINISDSKAKVIMINFWATWCEACIEEMPSIVKLRNTYQSRGFEVFGVNLDESPEKVVPKIVQEFNIEFPVFQDPDGRIADLFDVHAIPLTVLVDQHRKILAVHPGGQDWNSDSVHKKLDRWLSQ